MSNEFRQGLLWLLTEDRKNPPCAPRRLPFPLSDQLLEPRSLLAFTNQNSPAVGISMLLLAFLLVCACGKDVNAQQLEPQSDLTTGGSIQDFEHSWCRHLMNRCAEELSSLLAEDFVRVDADGRRHNRNDYVDSIDLDRTSFEECAIECIKINSRNGIAIVETTLGIVGTSDNRDFSGFYRVIDVLELHETRWRAMSRSETKISSRTDPLWERVGKPSGKPRVVLFVLGSFCPHCMAQLSTFAKDLADQNCLVSVVSADTEEDLKKFPDVPFKLVADPDHKVFRRFGAFKGEPKHATVAVDGRGKLVFRTIGDKPYMNAEIVRLWIDKAAAAEFRQSDTNN